MSFTIHTQNCIIMSRNPEGWEDTPEKIRRFQKEIATFAEKWPDILKNGDPYYNPNLTLDSQDFSLKRL